MVDLSNDQFWNQLYSIVGGSFPSAPPFNEVLVTTIETVAPAVPKFRDRIIPVDSGDHQNFDLLYSPDPPESLILTVNGLAQLLDSDYSLNGNVITMTVPIVGAFNMLGWYRH
jgi:hypothetical protein